MKFDKAFRKATDPRTSVDVLTELAESDDWRIRYVVAEHVRTPLIILKKLATDIHR